MGVPRGAQPPSHTAYFVALGGVLLLLIMLLAYCLCFCLKRVKELATQPLPEPVKSVRPPPPTTAAYPVQPEVRESATAMARLCKQIPQSHTDTVFPTLSPNKPTMLATPTSPRSARNSPARSRSPAYAISPTRSPAYAISPTRSPAYAVSPTRRFAAYTSSPVKPPGYATSPGAYAISATGRVLARSPGSKGMPLQPPKVISQSPKKRPSSMPDAPTPAISVSEAK